jgi:hypothetical protein
LTIKVHPDITECPSYLNQTNRMASHSWPKASIWLVEANLSIPEGVAPSQPTQMQSEMMAKGAPKMIPLRNILIL